TSKQVDRQLRSLIKKGYVEQIRSVLGKKYVFTSKFEWIYDYSKKKRLSDFVVNTGPIIVG
ncbi:hypothetical protein ACTGYI_10410, partial [Streptococcus suis]